MTEITPAAHGRPPDAGLTAKILDETLRQLQSGAYASLRIERVAAEVGCGKTAVYRRWENKAALAAAALKHSSRLGEIPDTGNVVDDLVAHAWRNVENQRARGFGTDTAHNIWASITDPNVRAYFWDEFLADRRRMGREILVRAVTRGELPARTDSDLILDALAGLAIYRNTVRLATVDESEVRALASALVNAPPLKTESSDAP